MGAAEIETFLNHLANERNVAASTHNQALSALLFRYGEVLGIDLPWLDDIARPKRPRRVPLVLSRDEVRTVPELLWHRDVGTKMVYTDVLYRGGLGVRSPLDDGA